MEQSCQIHFIDCMGYWDLSSQIISIILIVIIAYKTSSNIRNLLQQKQSLSDIELKKSIVRKLIVNVLSFVYEILLAASILFSLIIFLVYYKNLKQIRDNKLNLWYKWSQIIFINILNCLNLTVGFIYWKAVRAYFKISQKNLPIIFYRHIKIIFVLCYIVNFVIIVVSLVLLLVTDQAHYEKYQIQVIGIVNTIGVSFSTLICLSCRLLYQYHILMNISLNKKAIQKQKLYSLLIAFSSLCRLTCVTLNLVGIDYDDLVRRYSENCIDNMPYHGIMMLFITICINMIPPFIFNYVFACNQVKKKNYEKLNQYLSKNNSQSVRYV